MSLIPHGLFFYDDVVLWLTARTSREALTLTWCSWAGWAGWMVFNLDRETGTIDLRAMAPWIVALIYLPALVLVLRRPNSTHVATAVDAR
jgi:hypothetical protein